MKSINDIHRILLATTFMLAGCLFASVAAQTTTPQSQAQASPAQITQNPNLQTELGLTPDQVQKWRELNKELRPQELAGRQRVNEARRALTEAMESPNPNEDLIKQRAKELADAQSVMTQLQALRQARVLQILTPEQRIKLKEIRQRNQAIRQASQQQGLGQKQQNKRNGNTRLLAPAQRQAVKGQSKPKG